MKNKPDYFLHFTSLFVSLQSTKPVTRGRAGQNIDGIHRPTMPFVGQADGKGVYERYHSVSSNFANLNSYTGDNATVSVCVGGLYPNNCYYNQGV
jgi:hypothetical protein